MALATRRTDSAQSIDRRLTTYVDHTRANRIGALVDPSISISCDEILVVIRAKNDSRHQATTRFVSGNLSLMTRVLPDSSDRFGATFSSVNHLDSLVFIGVLLTSLCMQCELSLRGVQEVVSDSTDTRSDFFDSFLAVTACANASTERPPLHCN